MVRSQVLRISDAIAMIVRHEPATLATLGNKIPGFAEYDPDKAWAWHYNNFPFGAYLSEDGVDGLLHAVHNRRVAIKLCDQSEYPFDSILFNSPDWISVQLARPQCANFFAVSKPHIFHVHGKWISRFFEIEPGARYLTIAGPTRISRQLFRS